MKIVLFIAGCFLFFPYTYGQRKIDPLLRKGIEYHDSRQYDKAIEAYKQALQIDSTSAEAMYELSLSLLQSGDFESAIHYSDKLIDRDDKFAILAYNTKGSSLNYMGRPNEAIAVFLEGIERYEDFPHLYYNLGLAYFATKDYGKAKEAYLHTLRLNPKHSGAHLNLGRTMMMEDKRIESLLGLYYFLLLEPATDRSEWASTTMQEVFFNLNESGSDYQEADKKLIKLLEENEREIIQGDSGFDLFIKDTKAFFLVLNDIQEVTNPQEASVWDNYISFFKLLSIRGYTEPFCYYISHQFNPEAEVWRKKNEARLTDFARWLAQQE